MEPRPKLSPPQTCAALIDPREPYKLTSGTWTGKRVGVCAHGPVALNRQQAAKNLNNEGCVPDPNYAHLKPVLP
ncbi:hypothetical protein RLOC_00004407 [Lonchura striata]|uniref:Uncharacterized protein n=1 Tax=Lonchura striata TaxID=40157 RepID=A0A218UKE4_9PASE|nr:hypothetical protein RLOC_00004407 [Lonchura striata domestica]